MVELPQPRNSNKFVYIKLIVFIFHYRKGGVCPGFTYPNFYFFQLSNVQFY